MQTLLIIIMAVSLTAVILLGSITSAAYSADPKRHIELKNKRLFLNLWWICFAVFTATAFLYFCVFKFT